MPVLFHRPFPILIHQRQTTAVDQSSPPVDISHLDPVSTVLDPERQKYIWDAEHATHLLEWRFGKAFLQAWEEQDRDKLAHFFTADFQGEVRDLDLGDLQSSGLAQTRRADAKTVPAETVGSRGLTEWLVKLRDRFETVSSKRLQVLKIDQVASSADEEVWNVRVLLRLFGTAADGSMTEMDSTHLLTCRWEDEEQLGEGNVVQRWQHESHSLRVCPRPLMEEVTEQVGLADLPLQDNWSPTCSRPVMMRFQMGVADFDGDGWLDLAISTFDQKNYLLRNEEGKRFKNVTTAMGIERRRRKSPMFRGMRNYMAVWIDYDNDGFPDLLINERLYHNEGGKGFVNVTGKSGLRFGLQLMGCNVADYDADGLLDLYFMEVRGKRSKGTRPHGFIGDSHSGGLNRLWRNEGNGKFKEVTEASGASGGTKQTFASTWFFADDDHLPDLYLANDFGSNGLLRNRGDGTFEDLSEPSQTADFATSMGVASGDLNNDGNSEIYVANMFSKMGRRIVQHVGPEDYPAGVYEQIVGMGAGNRLYHRKSGSMQYEESSDQLKVNGVGWAYAPAMTDLNGDGWLDLYATTGFMSFDRRKPDG